MPRDCTSVLVFFPRLMLMMVVALLLLMMMVLALLPPLKKHRPDAAEDVATVRHLLMAVRALTFVVRFDAYDVHHFGPWTSAGRCAHCVRDHFIIQVTNATEYLIWAEVPLHELLTKTTAPYGRPNPNSVTRGEVHVTPTKVVAIGIDGLLMLYPDPCELPCLLCALRYHFRIFMVKITR